jgi:agmatinase
MAKPGVSSEPVANATVPANPTFLGVPHAHNLEELDAHIAIVGVPFGVPYELKFFAGAGSAPKVIREQSHRYFAENLHHYDFEFGGPVFAGRDVKLVDCGDVRTEPGKWGDNFRITTSVIRKVVDRGAVPIVLGGDDSVPIAAMRGFEGHGPVTIVQWDAHLDWRDEYKGGIREGQSSTMRRMSELPWVGGMMQIGLRGSGSAREVELADARHYGSVLVSAEELHRDGAEKVLGRLPASEQYFFSIDADGLDPSIAPGVSGPAFGGITYYEATDLIKGVAARGKIVGASIAEVNPSLDVNDLTSRLAVRLILNLIGAMAHNSQFD